MKTYLTTAEALIIISNWADYSIEEQNYVLEQSYLLVNSFIKSEITIPNIEIWDGVQNTINAPAILKQCQAEFIRYLLAKLTYNWTEDLQNLYDNNIKMLSELREGQLSIETQITTAETGAYIVDSNNLTGLGSIEVLPTYTGLLEEYYTIQIDSTGAKYPYSQYHTIDTATYKWKTKSSDWQAITQTCYNDSYSTIGFINVRFIGVLSEGEEWTIRCIPKSEVNTISNNTKILHQSHFNY